MNFDFRLAPQVQDAINEKAIEQQKAVEEENKRLAELEKQKALRSAMQSNVLTQLASRVPRNPASAPSVPSVDFRKGW